MCAIRRTLKTKVCRRCNRTYHTRDEDPYCAECMINLYAQSLGEYEPFPIDIPAPSKRREPLRLKG